MMLFLFSAAGCGKEDPTQSIADSYFTYGYTIEEYGDYVCYFHFYEENPELGAVFYAGMGNNQTVYAGTYEVIEEDISYHCYADRDAFAAAKNGKKQEMEKGTAPYTVIFYDFDKNELGRCGYDGKILYNDMKGIAAEGSGPVMYHRDEKGEASEYSGAYMAERGVPYLDFVLPQDDTCTVRLYHNLTYRDTMGALIEGSWSKEGEDTYVLKAGEKTDGAKLSVFDTDEESSGGKRRARYREQSGETWELVSVEQPVLVGLYVSDTFDISAFHVEGRAKIKLMSDQSACLILTMTEWDMDQEMAVGTYSGDPENMTVVFEGDMAYRAENGKLPFRMTISNFCDVDTVLTLEDL